MGKPSLEIIERCDRPAITVKRFDIFVRVSKAIESAGVNVIRRLTNKGWRIEIVRGDEKK